MPIRKCRRCDATLLRDQRKYCSRSSSGCLLPLKTPEQLALKRPKPACHPDRKYYAKDLCKYCYNKPNMARYQAEWRKKNPEKHKRQQEKSYWVNIKHKYGLNRDAYKQLLYAQRGCCKICNILFSSYPGKKLGPVVDHCHKSGKVRGLLCNRCNTLLGFLETTSYSVLKEATQYLVLHDKDALCQGIDKVPRNVI